MTGFKLRGQKTNPPQPVTDEKQIQAFIGKADKTPEEIAAEAARLDPDAVRDKQLGVKVNEFENRRIEALAKQEKRSVADILRYAAMKLAEELIKDDL